MTQAQQRIVIPGVIIGGAIIWFLYAKSKAPAAVIDPAYIDDGSGTGTVVPQLPPVTVNQATQLPVLNSVAANERTLLMRDAIMYPALYAALQRMDSAEIANTYDYFYSYYLYNKKLYQYPNASGIYADGGWNTALYNAIQLLKTKYGIFLN